MTKPDRQDATVMLELLRVWAAMGMSDAMGWVWSPEFIPEFAPFVEKYPAGSDGYKIASKVCMWFETVGTLHKHGLLSEELLFDWMATDLVWERVKEFPLGLRDGVKNPRLYENFQAMAQAQKNR
jgi:hypothetical protein